MHPSRGFTLIELLVVLAIVAIGMGLVAMALPDGDAARLEEEGARLSSLLEGARAEARVAGVAVRWLPSQRLASGTAAEGAKDFEFVGLALQSGMPQRFLDPRTRAQVLGSGHLLLGPEAILPAQRVLLMLGEHRLELASDGLGPFMVPTAAPAALAAGAAPGAPGAATP